MRLGANQVTAVKLGALDISKLLLGAEELWSEGAGPQPETPQISYTSGGGASSSSHAITLPPVTGPGVQLILVRTAAATHAISGDTVSEFVELDTRDATGRSTIWARPVWPGVEGSVTLTLDPSRSAAWVAATVLGADIEAEPVAAFAGSNTLNPPAIEPAFEDAILLSAATTRRTDNTLVAPASWQLGATGESAAASESTSEQRVALAHYTGEGDGSDPDTWSGTGTTANTHAATIALKPISGPAPEPNDPQSVFGPRLFLEDFNTPAAEGSAFWAAYPSLRHYPGGGSPWPDTSGNGRYSGDYVSAVGGAARIRMLTEGGYARVAALQHLLPGESDPFVGQLYGRYEVRWRCHGPAPQFKVAWLLWPDNDDWEDGEVDYPEVTFTNGASTIWAFNHEVTGTPSNNSTAYNTNVTPYDWHTCAIEWEPGAVRFYLDGELEATDTEHVPSVPMHWVLQCETALEGAAPDSEVICTIDIDYVAAWAYEAPELEGDPVKLYFRNTTTQPGSTGTRHWDLAAAQGSGHAWLYPGGASDTDWLETHRFRITKPAGEITSEGFSFSINFTDLSASTEARVRVLRLNAAGDAILDAGSYSDLITAAGVSTGTSALTTTWGESDVIALAVEHRRQSGSGATDLGIRVQDADTWLEIELAEE